MTVHPRRARAALVLLAGLCASPVTAVTIRVPADQPTLQQAIARVAEGDVVELAAGTYPAPTNGFKINNIAARFTVRAAAGATVVLDGEGSHSILRFFNGNRGRGRTVVFEGLTFRRGLSVTQKVGGAVTLLAADAVFRRCVFSDNASLAATTGGGAVLLGDDAQAVFLDSLFSANVAPTRGGAIAMTGGLLVVERTRFEGNRVNPSGHKSNASGGAIAIVDGTLRVAHSTFEDNEAAWTGGAIYAFGTFGGLVRSPVADLSIVASTFVGNRAAPVGPVAGATFGGAIHVEDQTTLRVEGCLFEGNRAERGGALSSYRALVEVRNSVLRGNEGRRQAFASTGGAINVDSNDFADGSTDGGQVNRRAAELLVEDTLFLGHYGEVTASAETGGCVRLAGDLSRHYGDNGVAKAGTDAENRAKAVFRRTAFIDCDSQEPTNGGFGGAVSATFTDLLLEDALVLDSDALPASSGQAGGVGVNVDSTARLVRTGLAGNTASKGAAVFVSGSNLVLDGSSFIRNEVSVGTGEAVNQSFGAALYAIPRASPDDPSRQGAVTGEVKDCLFADNRGLALWEVDLDTGPINELRYRGNRFFESSFSDKVWVNVLLDRQGRNVGELQSAVVTRSVGSTVKASGPNQALGGRPRAGQALVVPARLPRLGQPAVLGPAYAAAVWSGAIATLGGVGLPLGGGSRDLGTTTGAQPLVVDGTTLVSPQLAAARCSTGPLLCLAADRFTAEVSFADGRGGFGLGRGEPLTADTGHFWFFAPTNVELVTKALDGRAANGRFWFFYGALSNLPYTIRVLDTTTGLLRLYENPAGRLASVGDTDAFRAAATGPRPVADDEPADALEPTAATACTPSATALCLQGGRYRAQIAWKNGSQTGNGQAIPFSGDTGFFWFFSQSNLEVVIKILDGRPVNGHVWVFFGALSNVEYTVTVTDTVSGAVETYRNPAGTFASVADTSAF